MTGYQHPILNDGYDLTVQRLQEEREAEEAAWEQAVILSSQFFDRMNEQNPVLLREYISTMLHNGVDASLAKQVMSYHRNSGRIQYRLGLGIFKLRDSSDALVVS